MVNSISSAMSWLSHLSQVGSTKTVAATSAAAYLKGVDRSADAKRQAGGMMEAITTALSQIGVDTKTDGSSSGSVSSTEGAEDSSQALSSFMQTLMAALHSQSGDVAAGAGATSADDGGVAAGVQGVGRHRADLEADLQTLMQKVATKGAEAADSTVGALQDGFASLESALGETSATLSDFLQAFSANLAGVATSGNVIKAVA